MFVRCVRAGKLSSKIKTDKFNSYQREIKSWKIKLECFLLKYEKVVVGKSKKGSLKFH